MGRKKIEIKKLEPAILRRNTFRKRYKGLIKKAKQLSILCDVPVLLVTTTISEGYEVFVGQNSSFSDVVLRYGNESKENLAKTKEATFELLRKSFTDGHVVKVNGMPPIDGEEDSERHLEKAKQEIAELEVFLGPLRNLNQLEKVESIEELLAMETSVRYLIARNKEIKAHILEQQNATFQHFSTSYPRDPRCSTSTVASIVPRPSNHIGPLYGSNNPTGNIQLNGSTVGSGSNPTGCAQQHGPTVGSDTAWSHSPQNLSRDPRCLRSTAVPTVLVASNHIGPLYGSNLTGSVQLNGPIVGNGSNPNGNMQLHGLPIGSSSNLTGSIEQHGPTVGTSSNPTGCMQIHHPSVLGNTSRNMPERVDFQDSNSLLDLLKGNLSEGAEPNQYMQDEIDQDALLGDLPDLPNFIDENYSAPNNSDTTFEVWTLPGKD